MSLEKRIKHRTKRRQLRVRRNLENPGKLPRISVFRSLNNMYAQVIDDVKQQTILSCSSLELKKISGNKSDVAKAIGQELAKRALNQGITHVVFDRGSYRFHGRVKSLAEGLREGGLNV